MRYITVKAEIFRRSLLKVMMKSGMNIYMMNQVFERKALPIISMENWNIHCNTNTNFIKWFIKNLIKKNLSIIN
jgi:hypothetical protein